MICRRRRRRRHHHHHLRHPSYCDRCRHGRRERADARCARRIRAPNYVRTAAHTRTRSGGKITSEKNVATILHHLNDVTACVKKERGASICLLMRRAMKVGHNHDPRCSGQARTRVASCQFELRALTGHDKRMHVQQFWHHTIVINKTKSFISFQVTAHEMVAAGHS